MNDLATRLKAQNNGTPWVDCNLRRRPRPHVWRFEQRIRDRLYYRCERCPVATMTTDVRSWPDSYLL